MVCLLSRIDEVIKKLRMKGTSFKNKKLEIEVRNAFSFDSLLGKNGYK